MIIYHMIQWFSWMLWLSHCHVMFFYIIILLNYPNYSDDSKVDYHQLYPILSNIILLLYHNYPKPYFSPCFIMNYKTIIILLPPIKPNYPIFISIFFLFFTSQALCFACRFVTSWTVSLGAAAGGTSREGLGRGGGAAEAARNPWDFHGLVMMVS